MGRRYACVLGLLAFSAVLFRGIMAGGSWDSTLSFAIVCLCGFAFIGGIAGILAEGIVDDSIRGQLTSEIATRPALPNVNRPNQGRAG
jgi:hypothetical protein